MGLDIPNVRLVIHWQHSASVEDMLQEFGRAGRDGKPAVSIMFHSGNGSTKDVQRLRFMAEKTVETSKLGGADRERLLDLRFNKIDEVSAMLASLRCFRSQIVEYFEGSDIAHRPTFSERLLDWVFGTRDNRTRQSVCCDFCDRELIKKIGVRGYISSVLAK